MLLGACLVKNGPKALSGLGFVETVPLSAAPPPLHPPTYTSTRVITVPGDIIYLDTRNSKIA